MLKELMKHVDRYRQKKTNVKDLCPRIRIKEFCFVIFERFCTLFVEIFVFFIETHEEGV